jgi:hypothetical protein
MYLGYGDGTFKRSMGYSAELEFYLGSLGVGDFNNDNQTDIAVIYSNKRSTNIYFGYCCDYFSRCMDFNTGSDSKPHSTAVDDLSSDH